ncbi:histone deacetylase [candidate division WOR-3 bacterium]|nr:histone deacetylase [candidate division WOR-3 bacterium]
MKIIFSKRCLEYESPGHPESPKRVKIIYDFLKSKRYKFIEPEECNEKDILFVHSQELLNKVKQGNFFDPDTPSLPKIYEYAKLSVEDAIKAMQVSLEGDIGFSIMRPPGHHANRDSLGGFCYFNNIAIAIEHFVGTNSICAKFVGEPFSAKGGCASGTRVRRAAILDIDCHHGNGTQDIFLGRKDVLYVSLHRFAAFYPGTGGKSIKNAINYPLKFGIGESEYLATLENALKGIKKFNPSIIGVSVGFDTYKFDPIGGLGLEISSYRKIGTLISELNIPTFYVLEGGYSDDLPKCVLEFLLGINKHKIL